MTKWELRRKAIYNLNFWKDFPCTDILNKSMHRNTTALGVSGGSLRVSMTPNLILTVTFEEFKINLCAKDAPIWNRIDCPRDIFVNEEIILPHT